MSDRTRLSPAARSSVRGTAAKPAAPPALPPTRLHAALAFAHKHSSWLYSGYTRADLAVGLQLMLGWTVLLCIQAPSAVWDWLQMRGASATLVLVVSIPVCPALAALYRLPVYPCRPCSPGSPRCSRVSHAYLEHLISDKCLRSSRQRLCSCTACASSL